MPRRFYDSVSEPKDAVLVALGLVGAVEIHIRVADTRVTCGFWTEEELHVYLQKQQADMVRTEKYMSWANRNMNKRSRRGICRAPPPATASSYGSDRSSPWPSGEAAGGSTR
jgi:hypothetical protein